MQGRAQQKQFLSRQTGSRTEAGGARPRPCPQWPTSSRQTPPFTVPPPHSSPIKFWIHQWIKPFISSELSWSNCFRLEECFKHLPCKNEALSWNPRTIKRKKITCLASASPWVQTPILQKKRKEESKAKQRVIQASHNVHMLKHHTFHKQVQVLLHISAKKKLEMKSLVKWCTPVILLLGKQEG
jgi:hypothetical protein